MKKGFTLIELLAVIIILAIVALIATPIVLDVINDAKESTAKSQAYLILDGANLYYAESVFDNNKKNKIDNLGNIYDDIEMSGKKPSNGKLYVNDKGLTAMAVIINNKCYKKEFGGDFHIIDETDCDLGYIGNDEVIPTIEFNAVGSPFNENGWAKSDFYVNINVIDNESESYSYKWCSDINDCEPIALVEESNGNVLISTESDNNVVCVIGYDKAGNQSNKTCSDSYKIDKENPVVGTINVSGTLGSNEWYTSNVTISSNDGSDSLSGHDTTVIDISSITSNTTGTTITLTTTDKAGNTNTTTKTVKVDKNAPTVTPTESSITIIQGDSNQVSSYFNISYSISGGSLSCSPVNTSGLTVGSRQVSCIATGENGLQTTADKMIIVKDTYADNSGANKPELDDKMIPVTYKNNNWVYADISEKWYDYDAKQWANAIVLNEGITKNVGDTINVETDVAMMLVWIPRYKYTVFNWSPYQDTSVQQINIVFEFGTAKTGTVICTTATSGSGSFSESCNTITNGVSTYTHPAFCLGHRRYGTCDGKELTGIWVGKFENSALDVTSNTVQKVIIKPNVVSWRNAQVSTFYQSILNLKTDYGINNVDSHMMKNMEWGAVAYLSQSKYGRCNNGSCSEISTNNSSSCYTGRSLGKPSSTSADHTPSGTYTYEHSSGQLASTTGNIYGIYDMSGGTWEYVMGNMVDESNNFYSSSAGFSSTPPTKYYDSYTYAVGYTSHSRGKLGDATHETLDSYGNRDGAWYNGRAWFVDFAGFWFIRGDYSVSAYATIFAFDHDSGGGSGIHASRSVIVPVD